MLTNNSQRKVDEAIARLARAAQDYYEANPYATVIPDYDLSLKEGKAFQCDHCRASYTEKGHLIAHCRQSHAAEYALACDFHCAICLDLHPTQQSFLLHMSTKHPNQPNVNRKTGEMVYKVTKDENKENSKERKRQRDLASTTKERDGKKKGGSYTSNNETYSAASESETDDIPAALSPPRRRRRYVSSE